MNKEPFAANGSGEARGLFAKNARVIADLAFGGLFSKKKKDDDDDDRNFPSPPPVSTRLFNVLPPLNAFSC